MPGDVIGLWARLKESSTLITLPALRVCWYRIVEHDRDNGFVALDSDGDHELMPLSALELAQDRPNVVTYYTRFALQGGRRIGFCPERHELGAIDPRAEHVHCNNCGTDYRVEPERVKEPESEPELLDVQPDPTAEAERALALELALLEESEPESQ